MLLYYITDRRGFKGTEAQQRLALLDRIAAAARAGVDYIQLREKDLTARHLESLAREAVRAVRENSKGTGILINGRADVAISVAADGVHLPSGELPAAEIRALWAQSSKREPVIGVSAHSVSDVSYAEAHGANFVVLAPIFQKVIPEDVTQQDVTPENAAKNVTAVEGIGLAAFGVACTTSARPENTEAPQQRSFPVFALGGVTVANAWQCIRAGAAGVAGIRLFQQGDIRETVRALRQLRSSA